MGERMGIPSAGVMTEKFVSAADLMARVLGADGYAYPVIEHPISSRAPQDLALQAKAAAAASVRILTGSAP